MPEYILQVESTSSLSMEQGCSRAVTKSVLHSQVAVSLGLEGNKVLIGRVGVFHLLILLTYNHMYMCACRHHSTGAACENKLKTCCNLFASHVCMKER